MDKQTEKQETKDDVQETAVVKADQPTDVAPVTADESRMNEILQESSGLRLEFPKITTPAGGNIAFMLENPMTGEIVPTVALKGIILKSLPSNVLFLQKYDGSDNPPDCSSNNGNVGINSDGVAIECSSCPYNQFGSGENGLGKACKNRRTIYILLDGEDLPRFISLPSTSVAALAKFQTQLMLGRKLLRDVHVTVRLVKAKNNSGIEYASYVFAIDTTRGKNGIVSDPSDIERVDSAMMIMRALEGK